MKGKTIFAGMTLMLLFSFVFAADGEPCIICDLIADSPASDILLTLDDVNYEIGTFLYYENYSNEPPRTPIENTLLFVYVVPAEGENELLRLYTDENGEAVFDFSEYAGIALDEQIIYTFKIVYCPFCYPDDPECGFDECMAYAAIEVPPGVTGTTDVPLAPGVEELGSGELNPARFLPSSITITYTPPPPPVTITPGFCLPLILIFALLGGAMYYTGRNPFAAFTLGAPRIGRHIRYTPTGRGMSVSGKYIAQSIKGAVGEAKEIHAARKEAKEAGLSPAKAGWKAGHKPISWKETVSLGVHGMLVGTEGRVMMAGPMKGITVGKGKGLIKTIKGAPGVAKKAKGRMKEEWIKTLQPERVGGKGYATARFGGVGKQLVETAFKVYSVTFAADIFGTKWAGKLTNWIAGKLENPVVSAHASFLAAADMKYEAGKKLEEKGMSAKFENNVLTVTEGNREYKWMGGVDKETGEFKGVFIGVYEGGKEISGELKPKELSGITKDVFGMAKNYVEFDAQRSSAFAVYKNAVQTEKINELFKERPDLKAGIEEFLKRKDEKIDSLPVSDETKKIMKSEGMGEMYAAVSSHPDVIAASDKFDKAKTPEEKKEAMKSYDAAVQKAAVSAASDYMYSRMTSPEAASDLLSATGIKKPTEQQMLAANTILSVGDLGSLTKEEAIKTVDSKITEMQIKGADISDKDRAGILGEAEKMYKNANSMAKKNDSAASEIIQNYSSYAFAVKDAGNALRDFAKSVPSESREYVVTSLTNAALNAPSTGNIKQDTITTGIELMKAVDNVPKNLVVNEMVGELSPTLSKMNLEITESKTMPGNYLVTDTKTKVAVDVFSADEMEGFFHEKIHEKGIAIEVKTDFDERAATIAPQVNPLTGNQQILLGKVAAYGPVDPKAEELEPYKIEKLTGAAMPTIYNLGKTELSSEDLKTAVEAFNQNDEKKWQQVSGKLIEKEEKKREKALKSLAEEDLG